MPISQIKQSNIIHNHNLLKPTRQQAQTVLKSLNKTRELLIKKPDDKIIQNILEDEISLLEYNSFFCKYL